MRNIFFLDTLGYTGKILGIRWIHRQYTGNWGSVCVWAGALVFIVLLIFRHYRCASTLVSAQTTAPAQQQKRGKESHPTAVVLEEVRWASSNAEAQCCCTTIIPRQYAHNTGSQWLPLQMVLP